MSAGAATVSDAEEQLLAQLQVCAIPEILPPHPPPPPLASLTPLARAQDVPTEQLMQIRKQVQEEAQYFNESFQQLRMAQS